MSHGFIEVSRYVGKEDTPSLSSSSFPNRMLASLACVSGLQDIYTIRFGRNVRISRRMSLEHPGRAGSTMTASMMELASSEVTSSLSSSPSKGPGLVKSRT